MGEVEIRAADRISFSIAKGEFVVIVGPSGGGKDNGFEHPWRDGHGNGRNSDRGRRGYYFVQCKEAGQDTGGMI